MPAPFEQISFDLLPEQPRRPHGWYTLPEHRVSVPSPLGLTQVSFRTYGSGPPLLLLHGLMTTGYSWRYAYAGLGEHYTVYMPDLPGAGRSQTPDRPLTALHLADWLAGFVDTVGISGCATIGNSMGGYLTMWAALRHPHALSRLLQLHGPALATPKLWALHAAMRLPGAPRILSTLVRRDPLRWAHRHVHYWDETLKSVEEAHEYGAPLSRDAGMKGFTSQLRDTMNARTFRAFQRELDVLRELGEPFPVPLLLVYSRRDPMVPPAVGDQLARKIPSARLVRMAEASHFAHVDAVDRFVPIALDFFGSGR